MRVCTLSCFSHVWFFSILWTVACQAVKNLPANAGNVRDVGSIPGSGRSPGGGHGKNTLQYSCVENPMDRGAWRATVHGIAKSRTRLKRLSNMYVYTHHIGRWYMKWLDGYSWKSTRVQVLTPPETSCKPLASDVSSLCLGFLVWKVEIIIVSTSQGYRENYDKQGYRN